LLVLLASVAPLIVSSRVAQAQAAQDSSRADTNPWIIRHVGLAFGIATASTIGLAALDRPALHELSEPNVLQHRDLHEAAADVAKLGGVGPLALSAGLALVSFGHPAVQQFALHNAEAIALAATLTAITKGVVGRALPEVATKHSIQFGRGFHEGNGPFVSFPSGHTAAAFAFATTVAGELAHDSVAHSNLLGGAAFAIASGVGVARVVQRVHWPSDLPLGAFIGLWSGYAVQARAHRRSALSRTVNSLYLSSDGQRRVMLGYSTGDFDD
jgi:membrane-associated phospholipid phosphatase